MANTSPCQKRQGIRANQRRPYIKHTKNFIIVKNHYQTIADLYTDWYTCRWTVSQTSSRTYFYCDPQEVDFELPPGAPNTLLDRYLAETWLPDSTCVSAPAQDPLEQFLPNPCNHCLYGAKINKCLHLDTMLLPHIESYHASAPIQQVLAPEQPNYYHVLLQLVKLLATIHP